MKPCVIPVALAMLALTNSAAMAREKPPVVLERASNWYVNYDDDSCSLGAEFGTADAKIIARFTWFEPSDAFQLMLVSKKVPTGFSNQAMLTFGPDGKPQEERSLAGKNGETPMLVMSGVRFDGWRAADAASDAEEPQVTPEQERAVQWLDLRVGGGTRYRLALQSMGKTMAAIRTCESQLVGTWGFDPAVQAALTRKPKPLKSPGTWLGTSDFPSSALSHGANGIVRFRLDVDTSGIVGGCQVLKGIQSPEFEKLTCDLIRRRARFMPALDAQGRPVASFYVNSVTWLTG